MMDADERQDLLRNTLIGVAAGLSAAWVMNRFQALLIRRIDEGALARSGA